MELDDYLRLLDWTGRQLVAGKRGAIPSHLAPILARVHINGSTWLDTVKDFDRKFGHIVGTVAKIVERARQVGRRWFRGVSDALETFN